MVNVGLHHHEEREKKTLSISIFVRETDDVRGVLDFFGCGVDLEEKKVAS